MSSPKTLLIVDDEPNVIKAFKRLFFDSEYEILTAGSGDEGLQVLVEKDIPLVISDYRMPGMSGVEFLSRVKELYPETIRMILSGYADVVATVEAINDGHVYKFIGKPWNDQELLTTVLRAFEQYQLQKENAGLYVQLQNRNRALEELTRSLEQKVTMRTRDLEMKNRALQVAQNILNHLPVGVMGVDSQFTVVYQNDALKEFVDIGRLELGAGLKTVSVGEIDSTVTLTLGTETTRFTVLKENSSVGMICTPLPKQAGVICLFMSLKVDHFGDPGQPDTDHKGAAHA